MAGSITTVNFLFRFLDELLRTLPDDFFHLFSSHFFRRLLPRLPLVRLSIIRLTFVGLTLVTLLIAVGLLVVLTVGLARAHGEGYQADVEFEFFHDSLIEALDLIGIDSVGAKPGDTFDRAIHASRKTVRTGERALDWTVAKVLRQGLIRPGAERAFLPAQVSVYRYDAALDTAPTQA